MKRVIQINATWNWDAPGKIAEQIGQCAVARGWESWIAYGRDMSGQAPKSVSNIIKVGSRVGVLWHGLCSRLFDVHGLCSEGATWDLVRAIERIDPDIIHLHNIHGYYLHYPTLFKFLAEHGKPIVWTLHDCWPFTGHCAYFDDFDCLKWQTGCAACPAKSEYPATVLVDNSRRNYELKKKWFTRPDRISFVCVSQWLRSLLSQSFLQDYDSRVIANGIDLQRFVINEKARASVEEKYGLKGRKLILGVANVWDRRKGLSEFVKLSHVIDNDSYAILLVGLKPSQIGSLPPGIIGLERTANIEQLVELYSAADVFVNPTLQDAYPTTNLEAMACGTPVITYRTGGSPESVPQGCGLVVDKYDIAGLVEAIDQASQWDSTQSRAQCRAHAVNNFDKTAKFAEYINLYDQILEAKGL